MTFMKISYIIPAHNEEARIGRCLESIINCIKQDPHDAEIIVVNHSIDKTKEIALRFDGVKVIDEVGKGVAKARDTGYRAATGDLIAGIDADVIMVSGWPKKVLKFFSEDRDLIALSGPFVYYDLPKRVRFAVNIFYRIGYGLDILSRHIFRKNSMLQGGNFIVRKSALDKINGWNHDFEFYGEDVDLGRRLNDIGNVKFSFDLPIMSSGRRLAEEGLLFMTLKYGVNFIWTTFFNRPFSKTAKIIRPPLQEKLVLKKSKRG